MLIHLFVQYYKPKDPLRQQEIDECLKKNIANRQIDVVHVLLECEEDRSSLLQDPRVVISHEPERITYGKWLSLTNQLGHKDVSILINTDIYLDESVKYVRDHVDQLDANKTFLALTRYNREGLSLVLNKNPHWCQDTWAVVRGKEPFKRALIQEAGFELGHPGCDNKIAYVMHSYGFNVSNPCLQWRTVHLHADQGRPYDSKNDKLIGIHAFVHPVPEFGLPSKLDFDLLIRHPEDITEITVNHWINSRKQYRIVGKSPNPDHQPTEKKTVSDEALAATRHIAPDVVAKNATHKPTTITQRKNRQTRSLTPVPSLGEVGWQSIKKLNFEHIKKELVNVDSLRRLEQFTHRFGLYADATHYYWIDTGWPTIAKLPKSDAPEGFEGFSKADKFATGFAYPVLDISPTTIGDLPRHNSDFMFWQYPCITEKDALVQTLNSSSYRSQTGERAIYIGLPWATFIDKEKPHKISMMLIASRIKRVADFLAQHGVALRVHTVCQHIFWYKFVNWFKEVGITDLWISHKELGWDQEEDIRLHPWSLYAVNFRDPVRQTGLEIKTVEERSVFASFNGAHMKHYISDVRVRMKELSSLEGYEVSITDMWHFNKLVYNYQLKNQVAAPDATDSDSVIAYNQKLSDSVFSLCPVGAGPNTLRLWESLAVGAIPVVLSDKAVLPNLNLIAPGIGIDWEDALLIHPESELDKLDARLRAINPEKRQEMQRNGRILYHLVEKFSPVAEPTYQSLMPLTFVDQFKNQQIHIAGRTEPVVDGKAIWGRASIDLIKNVESALIHFDQTERLIGAVIETIGQKPESIQIDLSISPKDRQYIPILKELKSNGAISTLWFDQTREYWGLALKIDIKNNAATASSARVIIHPITVKDLFSREMKALDQAGVLAAASETNEIRKDDLFDTSTIESGEIIARLKRYAKENPIEAGKRLFPEQEPKTTNLASEPLGDGITMYVHLMNRNQNVKKNLNNWLGQKFDELILMDWSSEPPVSSITGVFEDPRVRVVRVDGQTKFIRSWAQNLATRMARNKRIFKCDSDVTLTGDFFAAHPLKKGEFWVGDWHQGRDFNERHLHGETYYHIDDFELVNGYDERIISYGHDDTNLKDRMVLAGLVKKVFSYNHIYHEPHDNSVRTTNQSMTHPMVNTRYHRMVVNESKIFNINENWLRYSIGYVNKRIVGIKVYSTAIDGQKIDVLDRAIRMVGSWYLSRDVINIMSNEEILKIIWNKSYE